MVEFLIKPLLVTRSRFAEGVISVWMPTVRALLFFAIDCA